MKNFLIFISVVLLLYGLVNFYIFIRGWQAIPKGSVLRFYYIGIFLVLSLSYVIGRWVEKYSISTFSDILIWTGSFWLGIMLYSFLGLLLFDLLRGINNLTGFFPDFITRDWAKTKVISATVLISAVIITIIAGRINALTPRVFPMDIRIDKKAGVQKTLNIAAASDIHLGTIIRNGRLTYLVDKMNSMNPDIILFAGDIVDEDLGPVIKQNLGATLLKLKAKYGVYAVTGNHEFFWRCSGG
ncbi:MAG: metallophosphoesterase [Ignavibacteria bacterium]